MKKLLSMLVIAIFLVSLIPVFADDDANTAAGDTGPDIAENTDDRAVKKVRAIRTVMINADKPKITAADKPAAAPGQFVSECVQELLKKQPNLLRNEVQARCRYREVKAQPVAERISEIKEANKERYLELRKGKLSESIEKCNEKDESLREKCVESFEARIRNVERITEKAQIKLQQIEGRKLEKIKDLNSIKKKTDFVKYKENNEFKARTVAKTKIENAKSKLLKAKERYQEARQKYKDAKSMFQERKKLVEQCTEDTEECQKIKEDIRKDAKEYLLHVADMILEYLDKIKSNIESNEDLSEEEAAEMLADLEEKITQIKDAKAAVEAAETKEDVIEAAKTLKKAWERIKNRIKIKAARTVNARIGGIIVKSKQLEIKLERILERMTENGQDTSSIEQLISDFNSKLEEARQHYETSVEKFKEAKAEEMPNTDLVREAQSSMKSAHKALQEAQQILRNIFSAIKQAGGEDELEATEIEDVEEDIEEVEEEDEEDEEESEEEGDEEEGETEEEKEVEE